ncbi:unnamed protein product, partial [Didymodactylos carnosus]
MPIKLLKLLQFFLYFAVITCFLIGLHSYFYRVEVNYCEMTYMYEYPDYRPIPVSNSIQLKYPRYHLYFYCEGIGCDIYRKQTFNGMPVLFIVGNADSYRQVRSLASVAYRMGQNYNKQLDYFSIDFNEELSALFGGVLKQQTEFVIYSIQTILKLYQKQKSQVKPTHVILVGNSIGGLLARAIFVESANIFDPSTVQIIITQATPHQAPVINYDSYLVQFYQNVNNYWKREWNNTLKHVVLLSLAGGDRDLCSLHGLTDETRSIDVLTTAIPQVWTSTDHRCIVWCRQLVLTTTRALFELIKVGTNILDKSTMDIMSIFKQHFSPTLSDINADLLIPTGHISLDNPITLDKSVTEVKHGKKDYLIPLKNSNFYKIYIISNVVRSHWIYLTNEPLENNDNKWSITDITEWLLPIPPLYSNIKMMKINITDVSKKYDYILLRMTDHATTQIFQVKNNNDDERHIQFHSYGSTTYHFNSTGYVKLYIPNLTYLWQVYGVQLESSNCPTTKQRPLIHFHVPWSNEDVYNLVTLRDPSATRSSSASSSSSSLLSVPLTRNMLLKLHRPRLNFSKNDDYPSLELFLNVQCAYTLTITYSYLDILSQFIRYYIFLLPSFLFSVLCISLAIQIHFPTMKTYETMFLWSIHLPIAGALTIFDKLVIVLYPLRSSDLIIHLYATGYYFFLLPFVFYLLALTILAIVSYLFDRLCFDLIRYFCQNLFQMTYNELQRYQNSAKYVKILWFFILISCTLLISGSCGQIALCYIAFFHCLYCGYINRPLREILTTLFLFHLLLVSLNLSGFIVHIR